MSKYATEQELKEVAKAYCKKMGYELIFANADKFGFQDKNEQLWTMSYFELADKLQEENKENTNEEK